MKKEFEFGNISKYRNVLMGIQIILIIFFHFAEDCKTYDVRYEGLIYYFYNYIRSSGVDLFLLLSGVGLYFSWEKKPDYKSFMMKRYSRLLIPYLLVAIPAWLWFDVIYNGENWLTFFKDVTFLSFFLDNTRWFWYILMMAACYWLFIYIYNAVESSKDRISEYMRTAFLCLLCVTLLMMFQLYYKELYNSMNVALARFPAFIAGVSLGKATYENRIMPKRNVYILLIVSYLLIAPLDMGTKTILRIYASAFFNFACCLLFILILECFQNSKSRFCTVVYRIITKVLNWFGHYTLELYLSHVMIRKIMKCLGYYTYRLSYEAVLIILSVIIAVSLAGLTAKIQQLFQGSISKSI